MRVSRAGLACITRMGASGPEYLTQWSEKWQMFSLVGGHVEDGETFRECCVREIEEELELKPGLGFRVAEQPVRPRLEYVAMSGGAKVETQYVVELYEVELLGSVALDAVQANPANRWLTRDEIEARLTYDGQPISAQVQTVFTLSGVW